jgi:integrase
MGEAKMTEVRKPQRILTEAELSAMRSVCDTPLELAIFEALRSTGCRVHELCAILKEDLNLDANTVYLRKTKAKVHWKKDGGHDSVIEPRTAVLDEQAVGALRSYLSTFKRVKPQTVIFPRTTRAIQNMVKRWATQGNVQRPEEVHPHSFRHTRATELQSKGVPSTYIKDSLGWSRGSTTFETTYDHPAQDVVTKTILGAKKVG